MSVNINFKKSTWKNRQWVPVKLSNEFNNVEYYPLVVTKGISEQQTRNTYVTYREYLELMELDSSLPNWFLSKSAELAFSLKYTNNTFEGELIGWNNLKLINSAKYTKINLKTYYDFQLEDGNYRALIKIYLKSKPSNAVASKIRNIVIDNLQNINSKKELITYLVDNEDKSNLLQACKEISQAKFIIFEKLKQI